MTWTLTLIVFLSSGHKTIEVKNWLKEDSCYTAGMILKDHWSGKDGYIDAIMTCERDGSV